MNAFWGPKDDEECDALEADITACVKNGELINILFKGIHDGDPFEGRISLRGTNEEQTVDGIWIYTSSKKEVDRFSGKQNESEEIIYKARVTGKLNNFRGKQVSFEGTWDDSVWSEDGCLYEFEIDAKIA